MTTLHIRWQRLVVEHGRTCERCGATEAAVDEAAGRLANALGALGIEVAVDKGALDEAAFRADPSASNRIWLAGEPLEAWLGAESGESACCGSCGDAPCRTVTVDGTTYEAIPPDLIVRAGLLAAARLLGGSLAPAAAPAGSCCAATDTGRAARCC